jgi:hypothetical protein
VSACKDCSAGADPSSPGLRSNYRRAIGDRSKRLSKKEGARALGIGKPGKTRASGRPHPSQSEPSAPGIAREGAVASKMTPPMILTNKPAAEVRRLEKPAKI